MAVMTEENKMVFGALFKLRSLETYVKRLKPAIKKDDKGLLPKEKDYIVAHLKEISKYLKASLQRDNMKLTNTLSEAIISIDDKKAALKKPFYRAGDGVEELKDVILSNFKDDRMLVMAIAKVDKALSDTYKYMNKNYKGWD